MRNDVGDVGAGNLGADDYGANFTARTIRREGADD